MGLIAVLKLNFEQSLPHGYWGTYLLETIALLVVTALSLAGSGIFAKASNALLFILGAAILSIPASALFRQPFEDPSLDINFTGLSLDTLESNLWPHTEGTHYGGFQVFRDLFGILFPATSGSSSSALLAHDLVSFHADNVARYLCRCFYVGGPQIAWQIHPGRHTMGDIHHFYSISSRDRLHGC